MPKRKIDPPDPLPEDPDLKDARQAHIDYLIETQRMVAQHNREVAAREQREFGTGDQG